MPIAYATTRSMPIASINGLPAAYGAPKPNAPRTAEPDTSPRAMQFADVLRGVAKLNEICDSMQKNLIEAKSTLVHLRVQTQDVDQDLISAAYALCEFRDRALEKRIASASVTDAAGAAARDSCASDAPAAGAPAAGAPAAGAPAAGASMSDTPAAGAPAADAPAAGASMSDTPVAGAAVCGKKARGKPRCHVGRKVAVLWVPKKFPQNATPELSDLVPYRGVVVKHNRLRKGGTHLVYYEDGTRMWHKQDRLFKFL